MNENFLDANTLAFPISKKIDHTKIKTIEDVALLFKHLPVSVSFFEGDERHMEIKHLLEETAKPGFFTSSEAENNYGN